MSILFIEDDSMNLRSFLKLVEIQTKVASIIPLIFGSIYTIYKYNEFNITNFILMLISLLAIDMTTTAINNYIDYKKAIKKYGFNYQHHNAIVKYSLSEFKVKLIILSLFLIASLFGLLLYLNTDSVVLLLGILSFCVGIIYSYGPLPISRLPFGEIFSGFFMGFVIVFISIYIHIFDNNFIELSYNNGVIQSKIDLFFLLEIFFVSLPLVLGITNIMLANNICDIEDDLINKRYTLPIFIGKEKSLKLFKIFYIIVYLIILILILLKVLPLFSLIVLLTFTIINKNINKFFKLQTKKDTFVLSVKNLLIINITYILSIGITIIFKQ